MDTRHRNYYLVNLNNNWNCPGWWCSGWDSYGRIYDRNLKTLIKSVPSLKIRQCNEDDRYKGNFGIKISCRHSDNQTLLKLLDTLRDVTYAELS